MRGSFLLTVLSACLTAGLAGCGKIPTWGELTGQQQPQAAPTTSVQPAPPVIPVQPAPQEPSPDEIIAKFYALQPTEVTDAAITQLTSLKEGADRITEINADNSAVTKNAFGAIERLTNLRQLRLNRTQIDDEVCQKLGNLSSLEVLALADTRVTDVGVAALSGLQNLKHLELTRCALSMNGFRAIGNLPSLKAIHIDSTNLNDAALDLVCNAKTLTELTLSRNAITDYGLMSLSKVEPLEYLEIGHTRITCEALSKVTKGGGLKNLLYLGVYACPITEKGAVAIGSIKSLERLNIGEMPHMNDIGFATITRGMKNLKYINLSRCSGIDGSGFKVLQGSKSMEVLLIDQCPKIGDPAIKILKTMKNLKQISVGATAITPRGIEELKSALPDLRVN